MTLDRYILAIGSLSDNAVLAFRTLCLLSKGCNKFVLKGGSLSKSLGWPGDSGRKQATRAINELVCSGLIKVSDGQTKSVELVGPDAEVVVKEVEKDNPFYDDLLKAANENLPKRTQRMTKELRAKVDQWIGTHINGEDTIFKAIEMAKDNSVVKKYGNMDLSLLLDRADDLLSGRYAEHSKKNREHTDKFGLPLTPESNKNIFEPII